MISGGEAANRVGETIGMRCFESFFKHTWRPQQVHQMDPLSRFGPATAETHRHAAGEVTELGEVRVQSATAAASTAHTSGHTAVHAKAPCKNGGCKAFWRSGRVTGDAGEPRTESPWHSLKTVFLLSVIVAFLLWIVVYTLLDQYRIFESRSATDEDVIVVGNEQQSEINQQPQSQLQSQSQLQRSQLPSSSSTYTRDRGTDPMRHPTAWRLRDGDDDDDDDDDDENEEEQSDNFSATIERRALPRMILVGWDNFRTKLLLFLIACLFVWACVFFPLLTT